MLSIESKEYLYFPNTKGKSLSYTAYMLLAVKKLFGGNQTFIFFVAITILAFILRLWMLGSVPYGLSNDESGYIYSSYSIWHTSHDVAGKFLPLSINLDNSFSPVYIYTDAPFVGILGLSPFAGRLPYALISVLCIPLLFFLTRLLTKNNAIALLAAFGLAVSPWHLQLSRGALDADFALFFYLLGIYLFCLKPSKLKYIFFSLIAFLLGFYSYHATKIFFIFLLPILFLYYQQLLRKHKMVTALFLVGCVSIFLSFIYISKTQNVTRQQVLLFSDTQTAAKVVNAERAYNNAPALLKTIFSNKLLFQLRIVRENYLQAFSPQYLFLYGEPSSLKQQYSFFTSGELYILELPFLLIGLYALFRYKYSKFPLLMLLIAPLPSAFSLDLSYINRSIMMLPFLEIIVGIGLYTSYQYFERRKKYTIAFISIITIIFLFLFSEYLYTYYFRYPNFGAEGWRASSKDISQYVGLNHAKYKDVYIVNNERMFLLQYGIWNTIAPGAMQTLWKNFDTNASLGNVHFITSCPKDLQFYTKQNTLLVTKNPCEPDMKPTEKIVDKAETLRTIWYIYRLQEEPQLLQ